MDLGARPAKIFFVITLPIISPAIVSGWLLAFTLSLDDLSSFTPPPHTPADTRFMQRMIPHHEQALRMTALVGTVPLQMRDSTFRLTEAAEPRLAQGYSGSTGPPVGFRRIHLRPAGNAGNERDVAAIAAHGFHRECALVR